MNPVDEMLRRVFVAEEDGHEGRPLYASIVAKALPAKFGGATVLLSPSGHMRSALYVDAGPRRPIVVEIVDTEERIDGLPWTIDEMVTSGLVTLKQVTSIHCRRVRGGNAA